MNEVFLEEHVETLTVPSFLTLQSVYTMAILFFFGNDQISGILNHLNIAENLNLGEKIP